MVAEGSIDTACSFFPHKITPLQRGIWEEERLEHALVPGASYQASNRGKQPQFPSPIPGSHAHTAGGHSVTQHATLCATPLSAYGFTQQILTELLLYVKP